MSMPVIIESLNVVYFVLIQVVLVVCLFSAVVYRKRTGLPGLVLTMIGLTLFLIQNIGPVFVIFILSLMPASSMVVYDSIAPFIKVMGVVAAVLITIGLSRVMRSIGENTGMRIL